MDNIIDLPNLIQKKFVGLLSLLYLEGKGICLYLPRKIHYIQFVPEQRHTFKTHEFGENCMTPYLGKSHVTKAKLPKGVAPMGSIQYGTISLSEVGW